MSYFILKHTVGSEYLAGWKLVRWVVCQQSVEERPWGVGKLAQGEGPSGSLNTWVFGPQIQCISLHNTLAQETPIFEG